MKSKSLTAAAGSLRLAAFSFFAAVAVNARGATRALGGLVAALNCLD